jgi:hypothetical protein
MRRSSFLFLALLFPLVVSAAQIDGIQFDERKTVQGQEMVLNGVGLRRATALKVKGYAGALYVPQPTHSGEQVLDAQTPKQFVAVFRREVSRERAVNTYRESISKSAGADISKISDELEAFQRWLPEFARGDHLTATYLPGKGVTVTTSGKKEAFHASADFGTALFGTWVGDHAADSGLRAGLLSGQNPD